MRYGHLGAAAIALAAMLAGCAQTELTEEQKKQAEKSRQEIITEIDRDDRQREIDRAHRDAPLPR